MKELFKDRTVGFYVGLAGAALALVADILFVIIDHADRTFSMIAFVLVLIGSLLYAARLVKDFKFMPMLSGVTFAVGFAVELYTVLPSLSDVWNHVNFIGGNAAVGTTFTVIFLVAAICSIVACFTDGKKE